MSIPVLPESAPFSASQRAWLNGFFAGLLGLDGPAASPATNGAATATLPAPDVPEEDFPWHDPALALDERIKLVEGRPLPRRLMAAMAQLDCGACGYLCETYSTAIALGEETSLTKCSPGGKDTARTLKALVAEAKAAPANGAAKPPPAGPNRSAPSHAALPHTPAPTPSRPG